MKNKTNTSFDTIDSQEHRTELLKLEMNIYVCVCVYT